MAKCNPLDARLEYKERHFITFGLHREPIKVSCNHCGKIILSNMEWVCGFCDAENISTKMYSFLNKCEACKQPPKCLACPHCDEIIFLINSKDYRHPARKIRPPQKPETEEAVRAKKARQREDAKMEVEHELLITRLNGELAKLKKTIEQSHAPLKIMAPLEIMRKRFLEHDALYMGVHVIAKEAREANKILYADDPEKLQQSEDSIKDWLENESLGNQPSGKQ